MFISCCTFTTIKARRDRFVIARLYLEGTCPSTRCPVRRKPPPVGASIHLDPNLLRKPHYSPRILPESLCWSVNATVPFPAASHRRRRTRRMESRGTRPGLFWVSSVCFSPTIYFQRQVLGQVKQRDGHEASASLHSANTPKLPSHVSRVSPACYWENF